VFLAIASCSEHNLNKKQQGSHKENNLKHLSSPIDTQRISFLFLKFTNKYRLETEAIEGLVVYLDAIRKLSDG
tara:strand:+ start:216 stop:434 length:219 start_codon:yes stop_codon:yes gene_type:complete